MGIPKICTVRSVTTLIDYYQLTPMWKGKSHSVLLRESGSLLQGRSPRPITVNAKDAKYYHFIRYYGSLVVSGRSAYLNKNSSGPH
jgi:hypothetical protein